MDLVPIRKGKLIGALISTGARDKVVGRVSERLWQLGPIHVAHDKDVTVLVAGDTVAVAKRNVRDTENMDIGLAVAAGRL